MPWLRGLGLQLSGALSRFPRGRTTWDSRVRVVTLTMA